MTTWTEAFINVCNHSRMFYAAHWMVRDRRHHSYAHDLAIARARLEISLAIYRVEARLHA